MNFTFSLEAIPILWITLETIIYESKGFNIPYFFLIKRHLQDAGVVKWGCMFQISSNKVLRSISRIFLNILAHNPKTCCPNAGVKKSPNCLNVQCSMLLYSQKIRYQATLHQKQASLFSISEKIDVRYSKKYKTLHKHRSVNVCFSVKLPLPGSAVTGWRAQDGQL